MKYTNRYCDPKGNVGALCQSVLKRAFFLQVWVRRMSRQIRNVHVNDVVLVSSKNAYGFAQLEERLRQYIEPHNPKFIYVVGRTNAGKSTFVNRFLWSAHCITERMTSRLGPS